MQGICMGRVRGRRFGRDSYAWVGRHSWRCRWKEEDLGQPVPAGPVAQAAILEVVLEAVKEAMKEVIRVVRDETVEVGQFNQARPSGAFVARHCAASRFETHGVSLTCY